MSNQLILLRARIISGFVYMYFAIVKEEGEISKCYKNLTVLKGREEISKVLLNSLIIYLDFTIFHLLNLINIFSLEFYI